MSKQDVEFGAVRASNVSGATCKMLAVGYASYGLVDVGVAVARVYDDWGVEKHADGLEDCGHTVLQIGERLSVGDVVGISGEV